MLLFISSMAVVTTHPSKTNPKFLYTMYFFTFVSWISLFLFMANNPPTGNLTILTGLLLASLAFSLTLSIFLFKRKKPASNEEAKTLYRHSLKKSLIFGCITLVLLIIKAFVLK